MFFEAFYMLLIAFLHILESYGICVSTETRSMAIYCILGACKSDVKCLQSKPPLPVIFSIGILSNLIGWLSQANGQRPPPGRWLNCEVKQWPT